MLISSIHDCDEKLVLQWFKLFVLVFSFPDTGFRCKKRTKCKQPNFFSFTTFIKILNWFPASTHLQIASPSFPCPWAGPSQRGGTSDGRRSGCPRPSSRESACRCPSPRQQTRDAGASVCAEQCWGGIKRLLYMNRLREYTTTKCVFCLEFIYINKRNKLPLTFYLWCLNQS